MLLRARPLGGVHFLKAHAALGPVRRGLVELNVVCELRLKGKHLGAGGAGELPLLLSLTPLPGLLIQSFHFPSTFLGTNREFGVSGVGLSSAALLLDRGDRVFFGMGPKRQMMQEDLTASLTYIRLMLPPLGREDRNILTPHGLLPGVRLLPVQVQLRCTLENHLTRAAAQQLWRLARGGPHPASSNHRHLCFVGFPHMAVKSSSRADHFGTEGTFVDGTLYLRGV